MGAGQSTYEINYKRWPKRETHERTTNYLNRTASLSTYKPGEKLSFGKSNTEILKKRFPEEFAFTDKGWGYVDGERTSYTTDERFCLLEIKYLFVDGVMRTANPATQHMVSTSYCDKVIYDKCFPNNIAVLESDIDPFLFQKCQVWIKSIVAYQKIFFYEIYQILKKENVRNHPFTITFINTLREFAATNNNYDQLANDILTAYSLAIRESEYKCAFPPELVAKKEKEINTPRECWYKDCAITSEYKLLSENIIKRRQCVINICDINIDNLNIGNNEILITCQNKYEGGKIDVESLPFRVDQQTPFFIPTYVNSVLPILVMLFFLLK